MLGALPAAALEGLHKPAKRLLGDLGRIADQNRADGGAADQGNLEGKRLHGAMPARQEKAAHYKDDH